jgi:hypothetical protein
MRPYFLKLLPGGRRVLRYGAAAVLAVISLVGVGCTASNVKENCGFTINQTTGQVSWGCSVTVTDPPGSYLCDFNASQALMNFQLTNSTLSTSSGTFAVTVSDGTTGATLGQNSFGYTAQGSSIYPQNPTALQNWLGQFCSYSDVNIGTSTSGQMQTTSYGSGSATSSSEYQGTTYASTTGGWSWTNPKQLCNPSPCRLGPSGGGK